MGLSTDAAERRAVELFGAPEEVGRRFRKRWELNLLLSPRWRLGRIAIFLLAAFLAKNVILINSESAKATGVVTSAVDDAFKAIDETKRIVAKQAKRVLSAEQAKRISEGYYHPDTILKIVEEVDEPSTSPGVIQDAAPITYDRVSIAVSEHSGWVSLICWAAVAAPFLISFLGARTNPSRFEKPLAIGLMLPVSLAALFVALVPLCHLIHECIHCFKFASIPTGLMSIGIGGLGAFCVLSDALDLPAKRKKQQLKILGYRNPT